MIKNFLYSLFSKKKKLLPFVIFFLSLAILIGIYSPNAINSKRNSWKDEIEKRTAYVEEETASLLSNKENSLITQHKKISSDLSLLENDKSFDKELFKIVASAEDKSFSVQLFTAQRDLFSWSQTPAIEINTFKRQKFPVKESFFYSSSLNTYLTYIDTVRILNISYLLAISSPIEKNYTLRKNYDKPLSFTKQLEEKFETEFEISYSPFKPKSNDGRKQSFDVKNSKGNKIAVITFTKPLLKTEIENIRDRYSKYQTALILLAVFVVLIGIYNDFLKIKYKSLQGAVLLFILIGLRFIIFNLGFPSDFLTGQLVNPKFFSSAWGGGLVKSPIEFLISNLFFFAFAIFVFRSVISETTKSDFKRRPLLFYIGYLPATFFSFLILRGLAASVRSIIFDSNLRYFKDPDLIPGFIVLVMHITLLLLSLGFVLIIISLFRYLISNLKSFQSGKIKLLFFASIYSITIFLGILFVKLQNEPLYNVSLITTIITLLFVATFFILKVKSSLLNGIVIATVIASISAITLLNYFNSDLEKESLKKTARELNRQNENLIRFMVQQSLTSASQSTELKDALMSNDANFNALAFNLWSKSALQGESVNSAIVLYDRNFKLLGQFSTSNKDKLAFNEIFSPAIDTISALNEFDFPQDSSKKMISGLMPISDKNILVGYIAAVSIYDVHLFLDFNIPAFLAGGQSALNDAINFENLNIFTFINSKLVNVRGAFQPSNRHVELILSALSNEKTEAWLPLNFKDENYISFAQVTNKNEEEKITVVALKEKELAWSFFNFFKVFIVHSIFLILFFVAIFINGFRKKKEILYSFRAQVLLSFLIISIIPLIALAIYNRHNAEEKSVAMIKNTLNERMVTIESFIQNKRLTKPKSEFADILKEAESDLRESFLIFKNDRMFYSAESNLTGVRLVPNVLDPNAYVDLVKMGYTDYTSKGAIDNYTYETYYKKISYNDVSYILAVSDIYNNYKGVVSTADFDVFLFGVYSLAVMIIIGLSTFLANRISAPIRKLTKATRSLAHGDLNVEIEMNQKGEITELVDGFNLMTRELKKSQEDAASLEREIAWKEMARQVAHEIKNPLTPMKLSVQHLLMMLRDRKLNNEAGTERILSTVLNQIENLNQIASEFSRFARMPNFNLETIDALPIIKEIVTLFTEESIAITYSSDTESIFITGDAFQFKRMLINFVRNSIQANATIIKIEVTESDKNYTLLITDNGSGIKEENIDKLFEKNFTTKQTGSGIGLKLSKRFIEAIQGEIKVKNTSENGTTFEITLIKSGGIDNAENKTN